MSRITRPRLSRDTTWVTVATVGSALLLAGCGSSGAHPATTATSNPPAAASSAGSPAAVPAPSPSSTPTPTPSAKGPLTIGAPVTWSGAQGSGQASGTSTVTAYQQDVAHDAPPPEKSYGASSHGYVWASLAVKICSDAGSTLPVGISTQTWKLAYDDGSLVEASSVGYGQFPRPEFPAGDTTLVAGRCVAGAIVFPVPGDKRPARAVYSPASLPIPAEWTIPAQ